MVPYWHDEKISGTRALKSHSGKLFFLPCFSLCVPTSLLCGGVVNQLPSLLAFAAFQPEAKPVADARNAPAGENGKVRGEAMGRRQLTLFAACGGSGKATSKANKSGVQLYLESVRDVLLEEEPNLAEDQLVSRAVTRFRALPVEERAVSNLWPDILTCGMRAKDGSASSYREWMIVTYHIDSNVTSFLLPKIDVQSNSLHYNRILCGGTHTHCTLLTYSHIGNALQSPTPTSKSVVYASTNGSSKCKN